MSGYRKQKRKKRVQQFINFIAFNMLFFALYLNFFNNEQLPAGSSSPEGFQTAVITKKQGPVNGVETARKINPAKKAI